jgi:hypothetical protein
MDSTSDKAPIELFVEEFNRWHCTTFCVESQPDVVYRDRKAVDSLAVDAAKRRLAIEHTLVQPFNDAKRDAVPFLKVLGPLDRRADLIEPGWSVTLSIAVGGVPRGVDWSEAGNKIEEWYQTASATIPEGRTEQSLEDCGFPLNIVVDKMRLPGSPGSLFVGRLMPVESVAPMVDKALRDKLPKLSATDADLRVLLCEMDSPARGLSEIVDAIEAARPAFRELQDVTEVWVARTTGWRTENFISWHLIWPLEKANNFQRGLRHEA